MVTKIAGKLTQILEYNVACRWDLYLDHAEGLANQLLGNEKVAYDLYRRSTQRGVVEKIWSPTDEAAFSASFPLWKHHPSIADAGKANFELLQCKVGIGITADIVINLGINMFRFWSVLSWTRLSTSDLRIKEYLHETAKHLKSIGFSENEAAPVMVALLAKVFDFNEVPAEFLITPKPLPEEVKRLLQT
jgi:hypothetical protein